jgi:hypothetical protein
MTPHLLLATFAALALAIEEPSTNLAAPLDAGASGTNVLSSALTNRTVATGLSPFGTGISNVEESALRRAEIVFLVSGTFVFLWSYMVSKQVAMETTDDWSSDEFESRHYQDRVYWSYILANVLVVPFFVAWDDHQSHARFIEEERRREEFSGSPPPRQGPRLALSVRF